MTRYSKAVAQMRKEGIEAYSKGNGGAFVNVKGNGRLFEVEVSEGDVQRWADVYDDGLVDEFKESDPYEILEEVARIFHHLGWNLGPNGGQDTDFIHSSEKYLEMVYKAFNPIYKK
jgi:hypothetical protein